MQTEKGKKECKERNLILLLIRNRKKICDFWVDCINDKTMSYTELESGYQGLKQNRPGFYVGHDGNLISLVSTALIF